MHSDIYQYSYGYVDGYIDLDPNPQEIHFTPTPAMAALMYTQSQVDAARVQNVRALLAGSHYLIIDEEISAEKMDTLLEREDAN